MKVSDRLRENDYLTSQNTNYRQYCQDIADYALPRKGWINTMRVMGERIKFNFLYDSTAIGGVRDTAAGFHTYSTNPVTRWAGLQSRNKDLQKLKDVKTFWHDAEDWMFSKLNDASFYDTALEWRTDKIAFGTGTFSMLDSPKKFVKFQMVPVGEVNRVLDADGELCGIYRNFTLKAHQAFRLFGKNAGKSVLEALKDKPYQEDFGFLHYVGERYERDVSKKDSKNMPYESVWISKKDREIVSEGGYQEMPYISDVFYKDAYDANGISPVMDCFAEIKLVNAMQRTFIRADMKAADPGYILPSRGFVLPLNGNPGAVNYRDPKTPNDAMQVMPTGTGKLSTTMEHIRMVQDAIRDRMFVNLFRSLQEVTKQMTMLEVQQRLSQGMAILGPVVNRDNAAIGKVITRLINMGIRDPSSGFPEVPEVLMAENNDVYDVLYLSPLAKAQRQSEVGEIQSFLGDVQAIGAIMPQAFDKIDEDKTIDALATIRGISPEIMREDEAIAQIRKQRAEQNALVQQLQMAGGMSQVGKTVAEAHKAGQEAEMVGK